VSSVGITATRHGLTAPQRREVATELAYQFTYLKRWAFRHGDCVGGDEDAAREAKALGFEVIAHPPTDGRLRAYFPSHQERTPLPYLERNRAIVDASAFLIACPDGPERLHSGTWSTVRYARSKHCGGVVIFPDGSREPLMT
jgi:hypothetical protein